MNLDSIVFNLVQYPQEPAVDEQERRKVAKEMADVFIFLEQDRTLEQDRHSGLLSNARVKDVLQGGTHC